MSISKWPLLAVAIYSACSCSAQYSDSIKHYIAIKSSATVNNTNASGSYVTNQELKYRIRMKSIALNESAIWMYGEQQKMLTNNDFASSLTVDVHKLGPHWNCWTLANFTSSYSLKVKEQYQAGVGIARDFYDRKSVLVNLSNGLLYEKSDLVLHDTLRDNYKTFRNSLRLTVNLQVDEIVSINYLGFYQQSLSLYTDYILKSNVTLNIRLKKWLQLTSTFTYNNFKRTGQETTMFTYGLNFERYY